MVATVPYAGAKYANRIEDRGAGNRATDTRMANRS